MSRRKKLQKKIKLESIDGINANTFTNENVLEHKSFFTVSESYKNVLISGLREMHPHLSIDDINNYLIKD